MLPCTTPDISTKDEIYGIDKGRSELKSSSPPALNAYLGPESLKKVGLVFLAKTANVVFGNASPLQALRCSHPENFIARNGDLPSGAQYFVT